ncbi:hypothetical protein ES708_04502 [subsurface metagenome]
MLNSQFFFKATYLPFLQFYEDELNLFSKGKVVFAAAVNKNLFILPVDVFFGKDWFVSRWNTCFLINGNHIPLSYFQVFPFNACLKVFRAKLVRKDLINLRKNFTAGKRENMFIVFYTDWLSVSGLYPF